MSLSWLRLPTLTVSDSFEEWDVFLEEPLWSVKLATLDYPSQRKSTRTDSGKEVWVRQCEVLMLKKGGTWCMDNFGHKSYYTMLRASF